MLAEYSYIRFHAYMNISQDSMSDILTGFSDLTRLRILFLLQNSRVSVNCLVSALELPQPTVSRHLCSLRRSGMIESEKHGTTKLYQPVRNSPNSELIKNIITEYHIHWMEQEPFFSDRTRLKHIGKKCPAGCEVARV